ncbi:AraC family transcriptional regulator [Reichenbachiella carrageenanivorans]|uniref:AraC family transcriptional regulator n=1 Tax=Reichenbachiella carrageenanivorans TaxID=2979869 RepID=A0ABY6D105_9BACT|nr:AraC family transcriptional regulator [Reichenbachiella carrageenanivorans]UXX79841.1 AraC family transcriptional regulator [Reichenbachiella carrageenanivorans]
MNPEYLNRSVTSNHSVSITHLRDKHFIKRFHYHEQIEIVAIVKSTGTRFVGDNIAEFKTGEIVVIGKDLPHMWQNSNAYFEAGNDKIAEAVTIHLGLNFLENNLTDLPENNGIKSLINKSVRGLLFKNDARTFYKILTLNEEKGYAKFLKVLEILNDLGTQTNYEYIASDGFMERISDSQETRSYQVHQFIMNNFKKEISLNQVAEVAHMNPSAFSRYFKKTQGKTLVQYINDIKIGFACKLLMNENKSILEVCYESGFKNASNFNKQFRKKHHLSPKEYRAKL